MTVRWPSKAPGETADYDLDWSLRLSAGDVITASTWTLPESSTLTKVSDAFISTVTKIFLSGGLINQTYVLTNTVTTQLGDTLVETVSILIKDRG